MDYIQHMVEFLHEHNVFHNYFEGADHVTGIVAPTAKP